MSKLRAGLNKTRSDQIQLSKKSKKLSQLCASLDSEIMVLKSEQIIKTKLGNSYPGEIVTCVIELIGEAEVPAGHSCGQIIAIISKHLYKNIIPISELPSERSALRFADTGHFLANLHVSKQISSQKWDLHSDGTSKDHTKYMGHQVTLADGKSLSLGFRTLHAENTNTLLDMAMDLLHDLSEIYDSYFHCEVDKASQQVGSQFRVILQNMVGLMSDRASVMQSFNQSFNKKRDEELHTNSNNVNDSENLTCEFLHCNAHFLLGLSTAAEKVLKQIEKDLGTKFGRDKLPVFKRFSGCGEIAAPNPHLIIMDLIFV